MTCIVGLRHQGAVYIGGDCASTLSSPGWVGIELILRADKKVFKNGPFVIGFTSSWRMGQLLRHAFVPPERPIDCALDKFMCTTFIDAIRACFKQGGFQTTKDGAEQGGAFLVGYQGRLFRIDSDFHVGEFHDDYAACGCGESQANGAMFATMGLNLQPIERITRALMAAERHSAGVRGPFDIESIGGE